MRMVLSTRWLALRAAGASCVGVALAAVLSFCKPHTHDWETVPGITKITRSELARLDAGPPDELGSWSDGETKRAIVDFIIRTTSNGPDFVPLAERVAIFADDGTLWPDQPPPEAEFVRGRIMSLAAKDPSLAERQPYKAAIQGDYAYFQRGEASREALLQLVGIASAGTTQEEYERALDGFFANAIHPRYGVRYANLAYPPMLELVRWLRTRGYRVHVCSAGEVDFVRGLAGRAYDVPPEDVMGSSYETRLVAEGDGGVALVRETQLRVLNDEASMPTTISSNLGQHPVMAFGRIRRGRGRAMLDWTRSRRGPSLAVVVYHDDPDREGQRVGADEPVADASMLEMAKRAGYVVASVRQDWKSVIPVAPVGPGSKQGARP